MESVAERRQRVKRLEETRRKRRGDAVWPTPDSSGLDISPAQIAPGRGDLTRPVSGYAPPIPTALRLLGRTVSFHRIYMEQPWVAAAVRHQLACATRVPLKAYRRTGVDPADREELQPSEHPLAAAIQRPWDRGSAVSLSLALLGPYLIYGNSITDVQIGRSGAIAFEPKDWRFCRPEMPWRDSLIGFVFDVDVPELEQSRSIDYVLHVADWSPTGPIGVSPLQQLGVTIQLEDAAQRFARATWQNGAKPATAITMSEEFLSWEPEQREAVYQQLREDVDTLHVGPDSAGRPALLPPGLSWAEIGQTTVEAGLIQQREVSRDEILAVYHLQPAALGVLHQQSRATIEVQREMCLPGDALISTDHGPIRAAEVTQGDRVWALRDGVLRLSVVSQAGQTGVRPLVTVRTLDRTLRCSDNHPVLVSRRHRGSRTRQASWTREWIPAGQLRRGDLIVKVEKLPHYGVRSCSTREEVSPAFMEFCGLWLGDGSVIADAEGTPRRVMITRADDARYMDHYRGVMKTEFRQMGRGGDRHTHSIATGSTEAIALREHDRQTEFCSTAAAEEICALGFGRTAHTKRVPEWVFELEPDLRAAFLRGFFDADGHVDKRGHVIVGLCNEALVRQLRELCISVGVPVSNVRTKRGWSTLPDGHRVFSVTWTFEAGNARANAEIIGSHDPVDVARMEAGSDWGRDYGCPPVAAGCGHSKVLSVEHGDISVPVYNITVPDGQNFVADGVVTHNTYMESLGPPMVLIEQAVTAQVAQNLLGESDLFVEYDFSQLLRGDRLSEIEALRGAIGSALMSPNEGRQALSMPKDPNPAMDEKYIPANNLQPIGTPPQRAGGVPEPVPPQQVPGAHDRYGVWRPTPLRRPNDEVEEKDGAERHLYLPESALTGMR